MTPLATLDLDPPVVLRRAARHDLDQLAALLHDDVLGATRESLDGAAYLDAWRRIDADPAQLLVVACRGDEVVGTLQLTTIPGLSYQGAVRGQLEAVRVRADLRGHGLGAAMVGWAVDEARRRGCAMVQLTTNAVREDAVRFYRRLGFTPSHVGLKLQL